MEIGIASAVTSEKVLIASTNDTFAKPYKSVTIIATIILLASTIVFAFGVDA